MATYKLREGGGSLYGKLTEEDFHMKNTTVLNRIEGTLIVRHINFYISVVKNVFVMLNPCDYLTLPGFPVPYLT